MQLMLLNSVNCVCKSTLKTGFHYLIFYRKFLDYRMALPMALALALNDLALLTSLNPSVVLDLCLSNGKIRWKV